jgi:hypothetical protein
MICTATAIKRNVVMLGPEELTTIHTLASELSPYQSKETKERKKLTTTNQPGQTCSQTPMLILQRPMDLIHHILEILTLEIPQYLHRRALHLLHVTNGGCTPIVNGHDAVHKVVPTLFIFRMNFLYHLGDFKNAVVDYLDAVVEVGELVLLRADVCCGDVFEHFGYVVLARGLAVLWFLCLVLLVCLLLVALLGGKVLLLLVLLGVCVAILVWLFAGVRVCGGDDEFVDFEGVGVFGGGGAYAKVVAFGEFDL